ncbi:hypothetical protein [Gemmatimonas sp.]|uniref:hypothetical protein n=1 Tax=Gemmatimonas sp. TaxID=1962908 RepID=UPI003DA24150
MIRREDSSIWNAKYATSCDSATFVGFATQAVNGEMRLYVRKNLCDQSVRLRDAEQY